MKQRDRVLELLRAATAPLDAQHLAAQLDLHVTTVRFHLGGLVEEGLARTCRLDAAGVGRPRIGYEAIREPSYADLVALMAAQLGGTEAERERKAEDAGRDWADRLGAVDAAGPDAAAYVIAVLERLGFQVQSAMSAFGTHTLTLCTCPLVETARRNPEVVRGIQRGLIQRALDNAETALGARFAVDVTPDPDGGNCSIGLVLRQRAAVPTV
ncbi:helix-turn-helix domain-containing protein [Rhodococcus sp. HNM0569]|nr:helix-turn-helix domain-containing protein [Rhodococcus sp. HNM0569]